MYKKNIVILGGSFNPPTKAHKQVLQCAMEKLDAYQGIFVPSSQTYVANKTSRQPYARPLSEETRLEMLLSMCDGNMAVSSCEYGDTSRGRTLKTLQEIKQGYSDEYQLWFILGADKIKVFQKWPTHERILREFGILWTERDGIDIMAEIKASKTLSKYPNKQQIMQTSVEIADTSSSRFWESLRNGKPDWDILVPKSAEILKENMQK